MQVTLKMFGDLRQYLPAGSGFNHSVMTLKDGASVQQLLAQISLPAHKTFLITQNNVLVKAADYTSQPLAEGDEIVMFPPIKGG